MANIQNELNNIKSAIFGKDVRNSIHDAIKQCYDDASVNNDNANMEVKIARGTHNTLNERFNSVEENIKNNSEKLDTIEQIKADKNSLQVLSERMDTFSSLPQGSTTGDAELIDIRVGVNGECFENAGESVRAIAKGNAIAKESISSDKTTFIRPKKNLFNGKYAIGKLSGSEAEGGEFNTSTLTSRCAIFNIKPNRRYTILKNVSERFRIASFSKFPSNGDKILRYIKDEHVDSTQSNLYENATFFTFTPRNNENFIVVYVSLNLNEEPEMIFLEGDKEDLFEEYSLEFNYPIKSKKEILSSNLIKGKNLFNGYYKNGTITGPEGELGTLTNNPGKVGIIECKPNTTYTISKSYSNRFRVGLLKNPPNFGNSYPFIVKGEENDLNDTVTVTTRENDHYLIVYVAYGENEDPPNFMQIEEGGVRTRWETYGYKFSFKAEDYNKKIGEDGEKIYTPEYYGAIGNANFIKEDGTVWEDSNFTIPAADDTKALKELFKNKYIKFTSGKKYLISETLLVSSEIVKMLNGNGSKLVTKGDIVAINFQGTLNGSANPASSGDKVFNEHGSIIHGLQITSASKTQGIGVRINKNFGGIIDKCNINFMNKGIIVEGFNRNLIISNSHIYAMQQYGIHFTNTCDLHQINILGCHISYCRKNIFLDDSDIYNMQITGCDIETSSYPEVAEHDIHVYVNRGFVEDLEIVGNTIEDHWNTNTLIKLESDKTYGIVATTISGNVIGNSKEYDIDIKGVKGLSITGNSLKASKGESIKVSGTSSNIVVTGNTITSDGGLIYCNNEEANIRNLTVTNNTVDGKKNMVNINANIIERLNISDNTMSLIAPDNIDISKGMINIKCKELNLSKVDDNIIFGDKGITKSINIESMSVIKSRCNNNMSDNFSGSNFYHVSGLISNGNI